MNPLDHLLEPGRLLRGALAKSLLREHGAFAELAPGQTVGPFRIVRELGRGGMGIVYLAARADGEYEQEVAIKWLPSGELDSDHLDQFRRERQILARLSHPHIARLLEGGRSTEGNLWFAMERVEGLPVDRHASEAGLDWRERVRLLLPILEATQFAHGRLLVHRDIKPGNVLVDRDGQAKLLDFGVAALLSETQAQHAFTPGFASPEQLAGAQPDVASDVWQLGRLLQVVLQAHTRERAAPRVPSDLAAIVARATEPLPTRRYSTASALKADLQRVLRYQPVAARRASLPHRLKLLVQGHPLVSLGMAIFSIALVAVITAFMLHLARQRDVAERARTVAVAVNAFLNDDTLHRLGSPATSPGDFTVSELIAQSLDKAEQRLQALPEVAGEDDTNLGRSLRNLGRYELAQVALDRTEQRLSESLGPRNYRVLEARLIRESDNAEVERLQTAEQRLQTLRQDILAFGADPDLLADVDNQLARAAFLRDDFALCEKRYTDLLPRLANAPASTQADTYEGLSICESRLGLLEPALEHARLSRALRERDVGTNHRLTVEIGMAIESALIGLGRYDEAIGVLHELHAELAHRDGETHPTTLKVAHDLGFAMTCAGRAEEGVTWLRHAATGRARVLGRDDPLFAMSQSVLAMALIRSENLREALEALREADAAISARPDANPFVRAVILENRADLALAERNSDSVSLFDAAIAASLPLYSPGHPRLAVMRLGRGLALIHRGDVAEGRTLVDQSLAILGTRPDCRSNQIEEARHWLARH